MAVDTNLIKSEFLGLLSNVGKAAASALFPRDFEYYALGLELADADDNSIDYFVFPIMPKSISKSENSRVNIKKSLSSVNVINSKSFQPQDISIKGNFGRGFSILINSNIQANFKAFRFSIKSGVSNALDTGNSANTVRQIGDFNQAVKTGYGCIKILQSIIDKARGTDDKGRPFKLYLYNPALGESYLVIPPPNSLTLSQDENQNNMIWEYNLNLTAISPLDKAKRKIASGSMVKLLAGDVIQKGVNSTASTIRKLL